MKSSQYLEEKSQSPLSPFMMIYSAAKEKNVDKLAQALMLASINMLNNDHLTPLSQLAFENDLDSVNFLIKFNADPMYAVTGFAKGNHLDKAYTFSENLDKNFASHAIAYGLGLGGHLLEAYVFLENRSKDLLVEVMEGLMIGEHHVKVEELLEKLKHDNPDKAKLLPIVYKTNVVMQSGDIQAINTYLEEVIRNIIDYNEVLDLLFRCARNLAQYVSVNECVTFLEKNKSNFPEQFCSMLGATAYHFSLREATDRYAFLEKIKARFPDEVSLVVRQLMEGLSVGGNKKGAYDFLEKIQKEYPEQVASVSKEMIEGFLTIGCFKEAYIKIEELYASKSQGEYSHLQLNIALTGILNDDYRAGKVADEYLIFKTIMMLDPAHQRFLHKHLEYQCVASLNFDEIFDKAKKLNGIMKRENLSYDQVFGWNQLEMRVFLLQGLQLMSREEKPSLPSDLFFEVVKFLSPLERPEVYDLTNKITLTACKVRFFQNLKNHKRFLPMNELMQSDTRPQKKSN